MPERTSLFRFGMPAQRPIRFLLDQGPIHFLQDQRI